MDLKTAFKVSRLVLSTNTPPAWAPWIRQLYCNAAGRILEAWSTCNYSLDDLSTMDEPVRSVWLAHKGALTITGWFIDPDGTLYRLENHPARVYLNDEYLFEVDTFPTEVCADGQERIRKCTLHLKPLAGDPPEEIERPEFPRGEFPNGYELTHNMTQEFIDLYGDDYTADYDGPEEE